MRDQEEVVVLDFNQKRGLLMKMKYGLVVSGLSLMVLALLVSSSFAIDLDVGARFPLQASGYFSQSANYGLKDDYYDNQHGFNSFITQLLLELSYMPSSNMRLFVSGNLNMDQAYWILDNNSQWKDKGFDRSDDDQFIYDDWQDLLKEAHVSWGSDAWFFRIGKQVVQWGQSDGILLTNLINPIDQRRGPSDVRFENSILPIWMVRGEYNTAVNSTLLQQFGAQFILDPAAKFRGNQLTTTGNEVQGVWAPYIEAGPFAYIGGLYNDIEEPDSFDPDYFSYGLKLTTETHGAEVALLGFYGRDRDYAAVGVPPFISVDPSYPTNDYDGKLILHPVQEGYYPRFKFVGTTFTREISGLKAGWLGSVAPVLRMEALYAFDTVYGASDMTFHETDEIRALVGLDWKFKVSFLNPRAYFFVSGQYFYQREVDYPDGDVTLTQRGSVAGDLSEDNHKITLLVNTTYFHTKLQPNFFWLHDCSNHSDFYKAWVNWEQNSNWLYSIGGLVLRGETKDDSDYAMEHKDQVYATITYRF